MTILVENFTVNIRDTVWQELRGAHVCRAEVEERDGFFYARATRLPDVEVKAETFEAAVTKVKQMYQQAMSRNKPLVPFQASLEREPRGVERLMVVDRVPSLADINAAFEEEELTEEQALSLDNLRAQGTARPTVPLERAQLDR